MNIDCAYYVGGKHQPLDPMSLAEAAALPRHGGSFVWIELDDPGPDVMEEVRVEFGLHELAIEDASVEHQRPKVEGYDGFHLIVYRTARFDAPTRQVELGELDVFLGVGLHHRGAARCRGRSGPHAAARRAASRAVEDRPGCGRVGEPRRRHRRLRAGRRRARRPRSRKSRMQSSPAATT